MNLNSFPDSWRVLAPITPLLCDPRLPRGVLLLHSNTWPKEDPPPTTLSVTGRPTDPPYPQQCPSDAEFAAIVDAEAHWRVCYVPAAEVPTLFWEDELHEDERTAYGVALAIYEPGREGLVYCVVPGWIGLLLMTRDGACTGVDVPPLPPDARR